MRRIEPWEVIVGNVGLVYSGFELEAREMFVEYVTKSMRGEGRVAGESVTLMHAGNIEKEYFAGSEES